jgi:hypothetical protein
MKDWDTKYGNGPPQNANSVVYRLWRELFPLWRPGPSSDSAKRKTTQDRKIHAQLDEFKEAGILQEIDFPSDDSKIDFIVRERSVSIHDPCPCGSGKTFKDCHWPEVRNSEKPENASD